MTESVLVDLIGRSIDSFGFEEGVIHITTDDGKVWMLTITEDEELYVELYEYGIQ